MWGYKFEGVIYMAICDDIMELLKDMSERLTKLEEKVNELSIGQFKGSISAQTVNIAEGLAKFEDTDITGLIINTVNAAINGDIETVQVDASGKVDVNGEIKENHVF